jgi:hypothetical protein
MDDGQSILTAGYNHIILMFHQFAKDYMLSLPIPMPMDWKSSWKANWSGLDPSKPTGPRSTNQLRPAEGQP